MSTRSGKRIHTSLLEDTVATKREPAVKSERKTRSRQVKEDLEELGVSLIKNKKRNNYVSYPTDDELLGDTTTRKEDEAKTSRVLRKTALKEQNSVENFVHEPQTEVKNLIRKSRRGKKLDDTEETENHENIPSEIIDIPKPKKNKKKKKESDGNPFPEEAPSKKSKKKKKKGKKANSLTAEDVSQHENSKNGTHNGSNMSVDSFHSAAGSPDTEHTDMGPVTTNKINNTFENEKINKKASKKNKKHSNNITDHSDTSQNISKHMITDNIDNTNDKGNKKRKSGPKDSEEGKHFIFMANSERDHEDFSDVNNGQMKTRNSNILTSDESNISSTADNKKDPENNSHTKSKKNKSKVKKASHPVNTTKDDEVDKMDLDNNKPLLKDVLDTNTETSLNVSNVANSHHKSRRSIVKDSTFDKSNSSIVPGDTNLETCLDTSSKQLQLRKSLLRESINNISIINGSKIEKDTVDDVNISNISNKQLRRKSNIKDITFDQDSDKVCQNTINSTFDKGVKQLDATYEKESDITSAKKKEIKLNANTTYDKPIDTTFDKDSSASFEAFKIGAVTRKSSINNSTFDKSNITKTSFTKDDFGTDNIISSSATKRTSIRRHTFDKNNSFTVNAINTTYEKTSNTESPLKRKSPRRSKSMDVQTQLNTTFDKDNTEVDNVNINPELKSSLISSDNSSVADKSEISRISITSDESEHLENIVNTTPLLIESSIDESQLSTTKAESPKPQTPLKREGTFTKESPQKQDAETSTPTKRRSSIVPAAGCTPYHVTKSNQKKTMLNVTRSIEKGARASVEPAPRLTRVMFCSPVDNPVLVAQERKKIIKSNLKGSNKSFVYEESAPNPRVGRKRSYTQNDADDTRVKRSRLTEDLQQSVDRLSRPRTASATAKLSSTTPKKAVTPSKPKSDAKVSRTKLPNFAALHQKQFDKMESLNECQERRAKRARQLLTPTAPSGLLERISPKNNVESPKGKDPVNPKEKTDTPTKKTDTPTKKTDTPTKKLPTLESLRPGFTRFGFKLNLDVNPFSIPSKTEKPKEKVIEKPNGGIPKPILPSLAGATSTRREAAKQTVMREKSFTEKRSIKRNENRSIIKGVRTNRRFELQMKMRNID